MAQNKLPTTAEEFAAALAEAENKGAEKATVDSQKLVKDLETKISLIEGNPLEFPRILNDKDEVYELPYLNPIIVDGVEYEYANFTDDESAEAKFGMTAKDVLADLFEKKASIFIKK